jgi:hypothetical protein
MGRIQKADWSDYFCRTGPKETETKRGGPKGDHRSDQTALGGFPKSAVPLNGAPDISRTAGNLV